MRNNCPVQQGSIGLWLQLKKIEKIWKTENVSDLYSYALSPSNLNKINVQSDSTRNINAKFKFLESNGDDISLLDLLLK